MESIVCSVHITKISSRNKNCLSIDFENDYNIFYHMAVVRKNHDFIKYIIAAKTVLKWNIYHKTNLVIFSCLCENEIIWKSKHCQPYFNYYLFIL